jgi:hypothetical protein
VSLLLPILGITSLFIGTLSLQGSSARGESMKMVTFATASPDPDEPPVADPTPTPDPMATPEPDCSPLPNAKPTAVPTPGPTLR